MEVQVESNNVQSDELEWKKNIPKGFHFVPTKQELIVNYLQPKVLGLPFPEGIIKQQDVYKFPPHELCKENKEEGRMYFFTEVHKKTENGTRVKHNRLINEGRQGFWRITQKGEEVKNNKGDLVGFKTPFVYYSNKTKTSWQMSEYKLPPHQNKQMAKEWTLCAVYYHETKRNEG